MVDQKKLMILGQRLVNTLQLIPPILLLNTSFEVQKHHF